MSVVILISKEGRQLTIEQGIICYQTTGESTDNLCVYLYYYWQKLRWEIPHLVFMCL